jgi:hypothetical protein
MLRLVLLLIIIAGVAGYFTRPDEPAMRIAADAALNAPTESGNVLDAIGDRLESAGAEFMGERAYNNYYVASKYTVSLDNRSVVECWGAFTQVKCNRVEQGAAA